MKYRYSGYSPTAQKVSGTVEASGPEELKLKLREMKIMPIRLLAEVDAGTKLSAVAASNAGIETKQEFDIGALLGGPGRAKPDLYAFTAFIRQLATLQGSGIPIVQALTMLADQTENRAFGRVLLNVQQRIQEGTSLTDALKRYATIFDKIFINLISAGELSGSLDKVLLRLAVYYEKAAALRRKVVSAMTYPMVIMVLVVVVLLVLLGFVVPTFAEMFSQNGSELPTSTKIVMNISNKVREFWYVIAAAIISVVGIGIAAFKNEDFKRRLDPVFLKLPLFGNLIQKVAVARFSRTLATMIQSGVPIVDALEITSKVAGNYVIEEAILKTRQAITEGNSIADPLAKSKVFPKMVVGMIAIGEATGSLDAMLTKIAEFYEDEVDNQVSALTSILEPLMIVIVGIVVAGVLIPMYMPIFKMSDTLSGG